ncbi:hypothetical protein KRR26_32200 [Corallococcus sp. M34]|nr:hypothetical protein [Citreicoccus inhibens]
MQTGFIRGTGWLACAWVVGCGGALAVDDQGELGKTGQAEIQDSGTNLPPCPSGYHCSTTGVRGACELGNPPACGPALPPCLTGFYCYAEPRGCCRPSP